MKEEGKREGEIKKRRVRWTDDEERARERESKLNERGGRGVVREGG